MNAAVRVWDVEQQIQMRFSPNLTCSWSFDKTSVCRETLFFTSCVWFLVHLFFKSACVLLCSFLIILSADYSVSDIDLKTNTKNPPTKYHSVVFRIGFVIQNNSMKKCCGLRALF